MTQLKLILFAILNLLILGVAVTSIGKVKLARRAWEIIAIGNVDLPSLPSVAPFTFPLLDNELQSLLEREKINFGFDAYLVGLNDLKRWQADPFIEQIDLKSYKEPYRQSNEFHYRIFGCGDGLQAHQIFMEEMRKVDNQIALELADRMTQINESIHGPEFAEAYRSYLLQHYPYNQKPAIKPHLVDSDHPEPTFLSDNGPDQAKRLVQPATDPFSLIESVNISLTERDNWMKEALRGDELRAADISSVLQLEATVQRYLKRVKERSKGKTMPAEEKTTVVMLQDNRLIMEANHFVGKYGLAMDFLCFWGLIGFGANLALSVVWVKKSSPSNTGGI